MLLKYMTGVRVVLNLFGLILEVGFYNPYAIRDTNLLFQVGLMHRCISTVGMGGSLLAPARVHLVGEEQMTLIIQTGITALTLC